MNQGKKYDVCVAIGPMIMMKFVCLLTKELGNSRQLSAMNPDHGGRNWYVRSMPCCHVGGEVKFACVDGPEFDGHLSRF